MCGRFALITPTERIKASFDIDWLPEFSPRYNISPSQPILGIRDADGHKEAAIFSWGLIPFWAKDKTISRSLVNARAETISHKPAFRHSFKTKRALVIMSGFFEWKRQDNLKLPYYFKHKDNEPIAVAAIWDSWFNENGEAINSCCLITTNANNLMLPIHDRMPVILSNKQQNIWLNHAQFNKDELTEMLTPCPNDELIKYPVTTKMNNARFEEANAILPLQ